MRHSPIRIAAAAVVLLLTVATLYAAVYRRVVTTIEVRRATDATGLVMAQRTPDYARPDAARRALVILEPIVNGSPDDQRVAMLRGSNLLLLNQPEVAEAQFQKSLSWGQRPEIYSALAAAQAARGNREAALASLGKALAFDPFTVVRSDLPDLREEAIRRFQARATPAQTAEMYLNMAIAYLHAGYPDNAVEMVALGATYDSRILSRPELLGWGDVAWVAIRRYAQIQRDRSPMQ